jgi:hypothetical protein
MERIFSDGVDAVQEGEPNDGVIPMLWRPSRKTPAGIKNGRELIPSSLPLGLNRWCF